VGRIAGTPDPTMCAVNGWGAVPLLPGRRPGVGRIAGQIARPSPAAALPGGVPRRRLHLTVRFDRHFVSPRVAAHLVERFNGAQV
jgi:hypothetical protein